MSDTESVTVELGDGLRSELKLWRSADASAPALLLLPALGIPAGAYRRVCEAFAATGLQVLAMDLRGIGSSSVRASRSKDWGYGDLVETELNALLRHARERLPQAPLYWFCHSLGGHLAVLHYLKQAAAQPPAAPPTGLILAASGSPQMALLAPKTRFQARFLVLMVRAMLTLLGVFRGDWIGFGSLQPATLMREWARFVVSGAMPLGDPRQDPPSTTTPKILALAMQGDDYAPAAAVEALARRLAPQARVELLGPDSDGVDPGHTAWLKRPQQVVERVHRFVCEAGPGGEG